MGEQELFCDDQTRMANGRICLLKAQLKKQDCSCKYVDETEAKQKCAGFKPFKQR